jgi:hypothetical protein
LLGAISLLALMLVIAGCGGGKKPSGSVSGTVSYKGKPVTDGFINFLDSSRGTAAQGKVDSKGAFTLEGDIEVGTYKVYLQPPLPEQLPPGKVSARPKYDIPPKFQDPAQTTVTQEVKQGPNTFTIEFKD